MGFHRHYIVEVTDGDAAAALRRLDEIDLQLEAILGKPTSVVHLEGKLDGRMVRHGGGGHHLTIVFKPDTEMATIIREQIGCSTFEKIFDHPVRRLSTGARVEPH